MGWRWHCYNFKSSKKNWNDALRDCQAYGGSLLRIGDRFEQSFLNSQLMIGSINEYWTDMSDTDSPGTYKWSDGNENIGFTNWAQGQPGYNYMLMIACSGMALVLA